MDLTDLLSLEKWLEFDMDFYERSGMNAYAFGSGGERITKQKKWANPLCSVIKGNPRKAANICGLSHQAMSSIARREQRIVIGECEAGLLKMCVPVFVDGEFLGIIGGCGLLTENGEVDLDVVETVTGMSHELVTQFARSIRRISKDEIVSQARYLEARVKEFVDRKQAENHRPVLKTFRDLMEEVHRPGLCHQCGGCVTFCSAMNYGALEFSERGRPRFRDPEKCIECGVCYMICPAIGLLDDQVKRRIAWHPPMGKIARLSVVRARDPEIRKRATDGGAVTAILTHLFDKDEIDGAAVTRQIRPFQRIPWLAMDREEVLESAGSSYDHSGSAVSLYTRDYTSYAPQVGALGSIAERGLQRVALVGTPCQINTVCKMQTLGVVPSDSIYCTLGLFCSGNYVFGDRRRQKVEAIGDFKWDDVVKVNIKKDLILKLANGEERHIPLDELSFIKRKACAYCDDYTAETADISFGGIGAEDGWTTVIARTDLGLWILDESLQTVLEEHDACEDHQAMEDLLDTLEHHSHLKKEHAEQMQKHLSKAS